MGYPVALVFTGVAEGVPDGVNLLNVVQEVFRNVLCPQRVARK